MGEERKHECSFKTEMTKQTNGRRRKGRAMQKYEHHANNQCERVRKTMSMYEEQQIVSR